jgi:hypothetical protein
MGRLEMLKNEDLREELLKYNLDFPVTDSTRKVLIKRLRMAKLDQRDLKSKSQTSFHRGKMIKSEENPVNQKRIVETSRAWFWDNFLVGFIVGIVYYLRMLFEMIF